MPNCRRDAPPVPVTGSEGYFSSMQMPVLFEARYDAIGSDAGCFAEGQFELPQLINVLKECDEPVRLPCPSASRQRLTFGLEPGKRKQPISGDARTVSDKSAVGTKGPRTGSRA